MSRSSLAAALLLAPLCSLAGEVLPKFTEKPTATKTPDGKVKIEFAVDRPTDVAVFIEDGKGKIVLRFDDETIGACDMYFSNRFPFPTWNLEVIGTEGAIRTHTGRADDGVAQALLWTSEGLEQLQVPEGDNWTADTAAWVRAFAGDGPPPIDAEEAQAITAICLACRQSAHDGRTVSL